MIQFKFHVVPGMFEYVTDFYLIQYDGKEQRYGKITDRGLVFIGFDELSQCKEENGPHPLFSVKGNLQSSICRAMADGLGKHTPLPSEHTLIGKVEAMTQHLEDMRRLVFNGKIKKS